MTDTIPRFWFELVGLAAVVGSLIFVGLELKPGRDVAIAGQYQDRASIVADYFLTRLESEHLISHHGDNLSESYEANLLGPLGKEHYELRGPKSLAINHLHMLAVLVWRESFRNRYFELLAEIETGETSTGVRKADQERLLSSWLLPFTGIGLSCQLLTQSGLF